MQLIDIDILVPIIDGDSIRDSLTFYSPFAFRLALLLLLTRRILKNRIQVSRSREVKSQGNKRHQALSDAKTEETTRRQLDVSHKIIFN